MRKVTPNDELLGLRTSGTYYDQSMNKLTYVLKKAEIYTKKRLY